MSPDNRAVALWIISFAALALAVDLLSPDIALRTVAASLLIFVLPGYSIMRLINDRLRGFETIVLSVALSIAVIVLGGLLLNAIGAFSEVGWNTLLAIITIVASLGSLIRGASEVAAPASFPSMRVRPGYWGIFAAALAIGLGAVAIARTGAERQHQYSFTELWMVAGRGSSENLATLGVRNAEDVTTTYEIALFADGTSISRRAAIVLQPGETWTDVFPLNGRLKLANRVEARLFRANDPDTTYRKVWLSNASAATGSSKDPK